MTLSSPTLNRRSVLGIAAALGGMALTGARPGFARQATPVAAGAWTDSILHRAFDPVGSIVSDEVTSFGTFADLELQTIAAGGVRPDHGASEDELMPWINTLFSLALPGDFGPFMLMPEWRAYSGFGPEDVYQAAEIGDPPGTVSIYGGAFNRDEVIAAWQEAGYQEIASGDVAIYSISEDESFSPDNPIQRLFISRRNNAAIIGDDLILFTSTLAHLEEAIAAATGDAGTLAANPRIAPLLAATPPLATGALVPGHSIAVPFDPALLLGGDPGEAATAIAEQMEQVQMPFVNTVLIGVTGGGPYPSPETATNSGTPLPTPELAKLEIALLMLSAEEAELAIEVAAARLETAVSIRNQQPFNEMFASWELSVDPNAPVARLSLELGEAWPRIWSELLYARDLVFIG